jgi:hypothetical protein
MVFAPAKRANQDAGVDEPMKSPRRTGSEARGKLLSDVIPDNLADHAQHLQI